MVPHQASLSWQTVVAVEFRFHWGQCVLQSPGPVLQGAAQLPCGVTLYPRPVSVPAIDQKLVLWVLQVLFVGLCMETT